MSRRFKCVAIGAGYFSGFQHEAWNRIPEVDLAAISNRTESKARLKMAEYGIPRFYADWREMIDRERPEFVDIITPPGDPLRDLRARGEARSVDHLPEAAGTDHGGKHANRQRRPGRGCALHGA